MKRIFACIIAILMVLTLSVSVFAETTVKEITGHNSNDEATVKVSVSVTPPTDVYSVKVSWESLDFTYTYAAEVWNATNREYEGGNTGNWDKEKATITVANHSNKDVSVKAELVTTGEGITTINGVTLNIDNNASTPRDLQNMATQNDTTKAETTYTVNVGGAPTRTSTALTTVAKVKVTVQ